jgi:Ca2+-binding EF-hand superfamily protein
MKEQIMSSISSVGSYSTAMQSTMGSARGGRPNASQMADDLFSKLDTKSQGYIEKSDLASALSSLSSSSSSSASADEIFSQIDSDSDGKVTKDELSSSLQNMMSQLDSQFESMRMSNAMGGQNGQGGMPPPPPPDGAQGGGQQGGDQGFSKDELTSQLSEIGTSDSQRSSLISNIVNNFDAADTNGDGKVSFKEAQTYDQSSSTSSTSSVASVSSASSSSSSSSTSSDSSSSSSSSESDLNAKVMLQIMRLMHAYGGVNSNDNASAAGSALSAIA